MEAVLKLRAFGYLVELTPTGRVRYRLPNGLPEPDPATVAQVLADLKARKGEAIAYLKAETKPAPIRRRDLDRSPFTFTRPDPDGGFRAWRWGQPWPVGKGETEFDAVMSLWDAEEALEREGRQP